MKTSLTKTILLLIALVSLSPGSAVAEGGTVWALPLKVNDANSKVKFNVDTTWHVVHGSTSGLQGAVDLADPNDPNSIVSEIRIPVENFETGWDMRDDSLHEHMNSDKYKEVIWRSSSLEGDCLTTLQSQDSCDAWLIGQLTICDVTAEKKIPVNITKKGDLFTVRGKYTFNWLDFHVDDPSMIGASVEPDVTVSYRIDIPSKPAAE